LLNIGQCELVGERLVVVGPDHSRPVWAELWECCAPIVVTPKKGTNKIRMCVDLSQLNKYVKRERYQSTTLAQTVADIATESAKTFTKLDAMKAYH